MSKQLLKQYMKTHEGLVKSGMTSLAKGLEAQILALKAKTETEEKAKGLPFTPEQIEVIGYRPANDPDKLIGMVGNGYNKFTPAQWIRYLSNPATVARILELSHAIVNGTQVVPEPVAKQVKTA